MSKLETLFANNRAWAAARQRVDPNFFQRLCAIQNPRYLWIGCADSRVPANEIVGMDPGELFVHRNVANLVPPGDANALSVIQYAVDTLRVEYIIVTGHYGCGGVLAAFSENGASPLAGWIDHVRCVRDTHADELNALPDHDTRWRRLCELNVAAQVQAVCATSLVRAAWKRGQRLAVHGCIYDLHDGLLRDLNISTEGLED
jgi:carbonic anhydrase